MVLEVDQWVYRSSSPGMSIFEKIVMKEGRNRKILMALGVDQMGES